MDWKTLREEKLAKAAAFRPTESRGGAWWSALDRLGDVWGHFMVRSWWEKGMVIGTGVLLTILTPIAAFALMGDDEGQAALIPTSTPVAIIANSGPSPTITPQATSTPKAVPPSPTPKPPNREDCDKIRGTAYQSDDERDWFADNCDEPEPTDTPRPAQPPVNQQPTNTPQPEVSISASQARSMAATWIRSNPAFSELIVSAAACNAQASGGGWRVTCTGTTPGCDGAACEIIIRVCISSGGSIRQC